MTTRDAKFHASSEGRSTAAAHANCADCAWESLSNDGGRRERARVRAASRRHVEQTGHTVWIDFAVIDRIVGAPHG